MGPNIIDLVDEVAAPALGFDVTKGGDGLSKSAHSFILLFRDLLVDSAVIVGVVIVDNLKEYGNEYSNQSNPTYFPNQKAAESNQSQRS